MLCIHFEKTMPYLDFVWSMLLCNSRIPINQHSFVYKAFKWLKRFVLFDKVPIWNAYCHACSLTQMVSLGFWNVNL